METTDFYNDILSFYLNIKIPQRYEELSKIGQHISWYLSDETQSFVNLKSEIDKKIIEIDIRSAYPTICNVLIKDQSFLKEMNSISDKREKNIFISTTLPSQMLSTLSSICKMIILGIIFSSECDDILILEIKRDGCIISCQEDFIEYIKNLKTINNEFLNFINKNNFELHTTFFKKYIRCNKTSVFLENENLIYKGTYKYLPKRLFEDIKTFLLTGKIDLNNLTNIYSSTYYYILKRCSLQLFYDYYICSDSKILNSFGKYERFTQNIDIIPKNYLKTFLFPILLSEKF